MRELASDRRQAVLTPAVASTGGRLRSLDGLRAFSIGLVILSHVALRLTETMKDRLAAPGLAGRALNQVLAASELGMLGVVIFFVISGFLITSLLLRELERTGTIRLSRFYLRRTFRIFPAYYAYVAIIVLFAAVGILQLGTGSIVAAFTYTTNYCIHCGGRDQWYLGHGWSLAVEEQFYLLWPAVLLLLGKSRGMRVALGVTVLCPILRAWYQFKTGDPNVGFIRFEMVADSLATGCLLAGWRTALHQSARYQRILTSRWFVIVPLVVLGLNELAKHPSIHSPLLFDLVFVSVGNVCIALSIDWAMTNRDSVVVRLLNQRAVVYVGVLSYSLYLWQMPFLDPWGATLLHQLPLSLVAIAAAALLSYYLVERPCLRLRETVERRLFSEHSEPLASTGRIGAVGAGIADSRVGPVIDLPPTPP